jgi:hypothetical protein
MKSSNKAFSFDEIGRFSLKTWEKNFLFLIHLLDYSIFVTIKLYCETSRYSFFYREVWSSIYSSGDIVLYNLSVMASSLEETCQSDQENILRFPNKPFVHFKLLYCANYDTQHL